MFLSSVDVQVNVDNVNFEAERGHEASRTFSTLLCNTSKQGIDLQGTNYTG